MVWFTVSVVALIFALINLREGARDWEAAKFGTAMVRTAARGALTIQAVRVAGILPSLAASAYAVSKPPVDPNHVMTAIEWAIMITFVGLLIANSVIGYTERYTRCLLNAQQEAKEDGH